jgi:hypothetical protein
MRVVAIVFRRRRLRRADGIGGRKAIHQPSYQFLVDVPIRQSGFPRVGGVSVMRGRIEFLSHEILHLRTNGGISEKFRFQRTGLQMDVRYRKGSSPQDDSGQIS